MGETTRTKKIAKPLQSLNSRSALQTIPGKNSHQNNAGYFGSAKIIKCIINKLASGVGGVTGAFQPFQHFRYLFTQLTDVRDTAFQHFQHSRF